MNQTQKWVLVAVILIILAMLVYPPFQVSLRNGVISNMGYSWLIQPPKRGAIVAIVNISLLLIQWFGVLVVGCLIFFLAKNQSNRLPEQRLNLQNDNNSSIATADKIINNPTEPYSWKYSGSGISSSTHNILTSSAIIDNTELGFFGRYWYGKERLWKAFWFLGLLAFVIFKLIAISSSLLFTVLVSLPVQIFCWVSVWRCAFRTSHWFWAIVARCWVVMSMAVSLFIIIGALVR